MFHIYANSMLAASKLEQFQHHSNEWMKRSRKKPNYRDLFSGPDGTTFHEAANAK